MRDLKGLEENGKKLEVADGKIKMKIHQLLEDQKYRIKAQKLPEKIRNLQSAPYI